MRQFDIFRNPDAASARQRPYLVVLQSDLLNVVGTVIVAPLAPASRFDPVARLTPTFAVGGTDYLIMTHDLAAIPRKVLKRPVGTAESKRDQILAALDLIFLGF